MITNLIGRHRNMWDMDLVKLFHLTDPECIAYSGPHLCISTILGIEAVGIEIGITVRSLFYSSGSTTEWDMADRLVKS